MLQKGTMVCGKWTGHSAEVVRPLGTGANGEVYLVQMDHHFYAMKTHSIPGDIALEWGILDKLGRKTGYFPQPILIDDCKDTSLYFYLMSWIDGISLDKMLCTRNVNKVKTVLKQVLEGLRELHDMNHAFCDVKPQNILIERIQGAWKVRFVDVGGITPFGRSVRQFTPYYDRAFWGLGARVADMHYDLCGIALVFICLFATPPKNLTELSDKQRSEWLNRAVYSFPIPEYIAPFQKVLQGKITNVQMFSDEIEQASRHAASNPSRKIQKTNHRHTRDWTEGVMWISLCFAAVATLAAWASFFGWF